MRVLYVGNFKHPQCTEVHIAGTLEAMGHEVVRCQENEWTAEMVAHSAGKLKPALFLWTRTWGMKGDAAKLLRQLACPSVAYHLDFYAGVERRNTIDSEPWWRCKYVFTADGGSEQFWRDHGVNHHWMPPAVYEAEARIAEPSPGDAHDVVFVGSRPYHKEWSYRPKLIDWLAATYGPRFAKFGIPDRCVWGDDLNRLYSSSKVIVGDTLCLDFAHRDYWSNRAPETLGRGGFLIHPRVPGMEAHFTDREHLVFYPYGDFDELQRLIDYYLEHDEERERIRRAGHEHVKAHHTFRHRWERVLEIIRANEPGFAC